jgi:hypothetical protein
VFHSGSFHNLFGCIIEEASGTKLIYLAFFLELSQITAAASQITDFG